VNSIFTEANGSYQERALFALPNNFRGTASKIIAKNAMVREAKGKD